MSAFIELLEAGEIDSAIQLRLDGLETTARGYRADCESAKLGSAAVTAAGVLLSANPMILAIAGIGAAAYAFTVLKDFRLTGRFCPIPCVRKSAAQIFESVASAAGDGEAPQDPLLDVMGFLPPDMAHEYELLMVSDGPVCEMLASLPPEKRAAGYSFLLRRTRLLNSLNLPLIADVKKAIALPAGEPKESKAIGANTRLGAIAAKSEAMPMDRPSPAIASPWDEPKGGWDAVIDKGLASNGDRSESWDLSIPDGEEEEASDPTNAQELLARLRVECPELLKLVKSAPIRVVGMQRTGKSTFARKLALLRMVLIPGHKVGWSTPHFEEDNPVPPQLRPFGCNAKGKDYRTIEKAWRSAQDAIDSGKRLNMTIVWDEFGGYDAGFTDIELLGASLLSMLRESSKHEYFPVFVAHGDQAAFYPGLKNFLGTFKSSTIKVEALGIEDEVFGTMRPSGDFEVTKLNETKVLFSLPEWLTVELLLDLLPNQESAIASAGIASPDAHQAVERTSGDRWLGTVAKGAA